MLKTDTPKNSQAFSDHVPLQHFDWWARTLKISHDKWAGYEYLEIYKIKVYFPFIANLNCTPSDRQRYPRLGTTAIDAELPGHGHKFDVKLQRLCVSDFLFAVSTLVTPYHFRVIGPTTLCENKDGVHCFTLSCECHNRYNKLFLCNSANGGVAWCNKNNSECFFCAFS